MMTHIIVRAKYLSDFPVLSFGTANSGGTHHTNSTLHAWHCSLTFALSSFWVLIVRASTHTSNITLTAVWWSKALLAHTGVVSTAAGISGTSVQNAPYKRNE